MVCLMLVFWTRYFCDRMEEIERRWASARLLGFGTGRSVCAGLGRGRCWASARVRGFGTGRSVGAGLGRGVGMAVGNGIGALASAGSGMRRGGLQEGL